MTVFWLAPQATCNQSNCPQPQCCRRAPRSCGGLCRRQRPVRIGAGLWPTPAIQASARISVGGNHQTNHFLEVISHRNEFLPHKFECIGVADGLVLKNNRPPVRKSPPPHQLGPKPVDEILGKITISGGWVTSFMRAPSCSRWPCTGRL